MHGQPNLTMFVLQAETRQLSGRLLVGLPTPSPFLVHDVPAEVDALVADADPCPRPTGPGTAPAATATTSLTAS